VGSSRKRKSAAAELRTLTDKEHASLEDPERFGQANTRFQERLVALSDNQTLSIVTEMLNEIVVRAATATKRGEDIIDSLASRRRGIRSQERLIELLANGEAAAAEEH
jgi:GntR family transcriptional regulator, transcriptional repressor for pyruvate dehydrogenase complex